MTGGEQPSESHGKAFDEQLPTLYDLFANGPKSPDDLALACLHQPADLLSAYCGSSSLRPSKDYLRWTFKQLTQVSHACTKALAADGLKPGSRSAGNGAEVDNVFNIVKPDVVVAQDKSVAEQLDRCMQKMAKVSRIVLESPHQSGSSNWKSFQAYMEEGANSHELDSISVERKGDDVIMVLMTSGTTSLPKGCPHTNRSLTSWVRAYAAAACCDGTRSICAHLPMSHIFGLNTSFTFHINGLPIVHASPFFEPGATLRAIREERITDFAGVPAIIGPLLEHSDFKGTDTSCLQYVVLGATSVTPATMKSVMHDLGARKVGEAWGMTEGAPACMTVFTEAPNEPPEKTNSGKVLPGARFRVVDPESGKVVPRGQPGELLMAGTMVIEDYWSEPGKDTSDSFVTDDYGKWLKTGDQAIMNPDGAINIVGRFKHLIIRGGENISPKAVEALILSKFDLEADVVGIPDEIAGEVPVAVFKPKGGQEVPATDIQETVVKELGQGFALQETLRLDEMQLDDYPKTASGKVQKNVLSEQVVQHLENQSSSGQGADGSTNTKDQLIAVWRKVLKVDSITAEDDIRDYADSLAAGRFPGVLKKETGHSITVQELSIHTTATAQAKLLDGRKESAQEVSFDFPTHDGPPRSCNMIHTHGDNDRYEQTRKICDRLLAPMGLKWDDVQDVLPLYSYQATFLVRRRPQSNNHRHAFVSPGNSVERCQAAIETALAQHDMFRTLAIKYDDHTPLHVVMRPSQEWFRKCITVAEPVNTAADLKRLLWNDSKHDYAAFPGPLFRVVLAHVKEENCAGLVYMVQHSTFDGISLPFFLQDLDALLGEGKASSLTKRVPFKVWAETEYNLRECVHAKMSTNWHVNRLAGLHTKKDCLFPVQKAPEWFKGDSTGWIDQSTGKPGPDRASLVPNGDGVTGLSETCTLPDIQHLKQEHGIDGITVMKAALALLNTKLTGKGTALFAQYQAGRSWPYLQEWQASQLPSAMEVDGPTVQMVVMAIDLSPGASVLEFLQTVQAEQTAINEHTQVPFEAIAAGLNEHGKGEGNIMYDVSRRQIFNWLPPMPDFEHLRQVQQISRTDVGILWNCMQLEQSQIRVMPSWDDAQLKPSEVKDMLAEIIRIAGDLATEKNWSSDCGRLR